MTYESFGDLEALVQEKIESDTDFQATLTDLSDEDKEVEIKNRKSQLFDEEIKNLGLSAKKNEELANNYKTRAEKAEQEAKKFKPALNQTEKKGDELSVRDAILISKSNIHEEDIDEVVKYSKFSGLSIQEALKDDVLKTIISNREEKRKSAQITNTKGRPSFAKKSENDLLNDLSKGVIPEKGSAEAEALFWARRGGKR